MEAAHVKNISVDAIRPNPHNPRRLFDEEPMQILKESVEKLGILVPVTVYTAPMRRTTTPTEFILLDGERRWRCAKELGLEKVPAIVIDQPSETQNILTMFHIHNVREGWQLMPTALKLKTLMDALGEKNERELNELTKLSISQIRRCKILLTYPKKFQNMMLAPPSDRMKADFFIELDRIRRPALDDEFAPWMRRGDSGSIELILQKYLDGVIQSVTDFRRLAEIYRAAKAKPSNQKRLERKFGEFLRRPKMTIDEVDIPGANFAKESKELQRSAKRVLGQISDINIDALASNQQLVATLKRLHKALGDKLEKGLLIGVRNGDES